MNERNTATRTKGGPSEAPGRAREGSATMTKNEWYEQGDVCIIPVAEIPQGAEALEGNVLAEGEATGHKHQAREPISLFAKDGVRYFRTEFPNEIVHEEHLPVRIPKGTYRVHIVQEYDHFLEETRWVAD